MKTYIAYVRVSTTRQSDQGTSLIEQRRAIQRYAAIKSLTITDWFEEIETAATKGRPIFRRVMGRLRSSNSTGLILHKIDRGARNFKDWADIGELLDRGVDFRFAHEDLDLGSRGGRLAADIQAVVAADYIRNLRDEIRKGIQGRLNQGIYPFAAPLGYLNGGAGQVKTPDPFAAPFVVYAFTRYATKTETLKSLAGRLTEMGLRTRRNHTISIGSLSTLLHNRFYLGEMVVAGVNYPGKHQALISPQLFDTVQTILRDQRPGPQRRVKHNFLYRGRLQCGSCKWRLTGEFHRAVVHYRCHRCKDTCVKETAVTEVINRDQVSVDQTFMRGAIVTGKDIRAVVLPTMRPQEFESYLVSENWTENAHA